MRVITGSTQDADGAMQITMTCVSTVLLMELRGSVDFILRMLKNSEEKEA